jgi:hypothetical protein
MVWNPFSALWAVDVFETSHRISSCFTDNENPSAHIPASEATPPRVAILVYQKDESPATHKSYRAKIVSRGYHAAKLASLLASSFQALTMNSITERDFLLHCIKSSSACASTNFVIVGLPVDSGLTWGSMQLITSLGANSHGSLPSNMS